MDNVAGNDSEALFKILGMKMKGILGDDTELLENEQIYETISAIEECTRAVEREHLVSRNEELGDISTPTMKFLFLPFYNGKCYLALKGMESRLVNILAAKDSFGVFLKSCSKLGLLQSDDDVGHSALSTMTPDAKRQYKIEKFKRDKAAKTRINEIQRQLYIARKDETDTGDHDSELRELYLTQIQCYARESMGEIEMINQEITMLRFHEQQQRLVEARGEEGQSGGQEDARARRRGGDSSGGGSAGYSSASTGFAAPPPQQAGPGISMTRTFKVGDQIMFSRETVKASIFGSHIAPPSMSLEEFGDQQKAEALERQAQRPEDGAAHANRRYKQVEEAGDEDDADLVDKAAEKDRAWDDWKDNNPRGWGNKMGKRF